MSSWKVMVSFAIEMPLAKMKMPLGNVKNSSEKFRVSLYKFWPNTISPSSLSFFTPLLPVAVTHWLVLFFFYIIIL